MFNYKNYSCFCPLQTVQDRIKHAAQTCRGKGIPLATQRVCDSVFTGQLSSSREQSHVAPAQLQNPGRRLPTPQGSTLLYLLLLAKALFIMDVCESLSRSLMALMLLAAPGSARAHTHTHTPHPDNPCSLYMLRPTSRTYARSPRTGQVVNATNSSRSRSTSLGLNEKELTGTWGTQNMRISDTVGSAIITASQSLLTT